MPPSSRYVRFESRFALRARFTWGGPASGIEAPLRAAGYDDTFYGCLFDLCSGPTSHPSSDQDEDPFESWTLGLRYLHDPRFGVALLVARTPLQVTDGFSKGRYQLRRQHRH